MQVKELLPVISMLGAIALAMTAMLTGRDAQIVTMVVVYLTGLGSGVGMNTARRRRK